MHKAIFYPVGNGDTTQIVLENGKRVLLDYRHQKESEKFGSRIFNLRDELRSDLKAVSRNYFDVVAFTHGDSDHIGNSTEFFELLFAEKYQGEDKIKIRELWVPASMILETAPMDGQSDEYVIWRQEARYRLKQGTGIRVFSKPEMLKNWLSDNGLTLDSRRHLITDAGQLVPGYTLASDKVEFFCHSPFVKHVDEGDDMRNSASLIFQIRFDAGGTLFNFLAVGDSAHEVLTDIVYITKYHKNDGRLDWDLFNIPHHCSYLALGPEKGSTETVPVEQVKELLLHGQPGAYIVSSSEPIKNDRLGYARVQPPHIQAKNTYVAYLNKVRGRKVLVTMEEPSETRPQPLVFEISANGGRLALAASMGAASIVSSPAPRAG